MRSSGTAVLRSLASLVACETSSSAGPCSLPTIHQLHRHLSYEADTPTIGRNRRRPRAVSDVRLSSAGDNLSPFPGLPEPDQEFLESATPLELDLAARNAPTKTLQLIGDPRTGVADDTTQPLGSGVSVQPIYLNEATNVQWYRYTMNGERLNQCHRDGRLSDHSKNLMYILRAKDPVRCASAAATCVTPRAGHSNAAGSPRWAMHHAITLVSASSPQAGSRCPHLPACTTQPLQLPNTITPAAVPCDIPLAASHTSYHPPTTHQPHYTSLNLLPPLPLLHHL